VRVSANVTPPREFAAKVYEILTPGTAPVITSEPSSLRNMSGTGSVIMAADALPNRKKKACIAKPHR
jgi:hypothetical protein